MGMGQAAGLAAYIAIDMNLSALREIDGKLVRKAMIDSGVSLDTPSGGYCDIQRIFEGDFVVSPNDMIEIRNKQGENSAIM